MKRSIGAAAALLAACGAGWAMADIPIPEPTDAELRAGFAQQAQRAGHPCARVTAMVRWQSQYARPLMERGLIPYVIECEGGARLVMANLDWNRFRPPPGPPDPNYVPPRAPDPVVWRFR